MNLIEKVSDILLTKNNIKSAIEEKGVSVDTNIFWDYPEYIRSIPTGEPREPFYLELLKNLYFKNATNFTPFSKLLPNNLRYAKIADEQLDILMIPNTTSYVRPLMLIDSNFDADTFKLRLFGIHDNEAYVLNNEDDGLMVSTDGWVGLTTNTSYGESNQFYFDILSGRNNKIFKSNNDLVIANSCDRTESQHYLGNKILSDFFKNCGNNIDEPKAPSEFDASVFSIISNFYKFDNLYNAISFSGWTPSEFRHVVFHRHMDGSTPWLNVYLAKTPFVIDGYNNKLRPAESGKYVKVAIQAYEGFGGNILRVDLTQLAWWFLWIDKTSPDSTDYVVSDGDIIWSTDEIAGLSDYIPINFDDFFYDPLA